MPLARDRTVMFADLRGSTGLYGSLGNTQAVEVVTRTVALMSQVVDKHSGTVVKTLGDGLMAVFDKPLRAVAAAHDMQESLRRIVTGAPSGATALCLYVTAAYGEIVEVDGDCFGDAVNVAARLLDHAGDNEVLITEAVYERLRGEDRRRFKSLEKLHLRGRVEPCRVYRLEVGHDDASPSTLFTDFADAPEVGGIRLALDDSPGTVFASHHLPVVIGRSPECAFCIDNSRVSRSHARIEWHSGHFHLIDQSSNGSFVRFAGQSEAVVLRRASCTLHGSGIIGLGAAPLDPRAACLHFEVLSAERP
ncbi:MAG TPA: adenylate/guanylate cyclase domain-containing protein [Burkholderiaceae bacterium]|nr:adenylate/guanylate cyclase domain-containing protein [Burkholderiaceae bacterium]